MKCAYYAVRDLLTYYDAEQLPFLSSTSMCGLLMKNQTSGKMTGNSMTAGLGLSAIQTESEADDKARALHLRPYIALGKQGQVAPTLKMLKRIDKGNGTDYMETIEQQAKLTEKHEMITAADDPCKRFGGKLGVIKMWNY